MSPPPSRPAHRSPRALVVAAAGLTALAGLAGLVDPPASRARTRPNLVLISLDTLRADHLGCYGYDRDTSPALDAFAARSVLFEDAGSHSPKTGPSHMSVMTGLYPDAHGVRNLGADGNRRLSEHVPTLATLLDEAGYRTAAFTGGGHVSAELGFADGFEVFEGPGTAADNLARAREAIASFGDEPFFVFVHTYQIHDPYVPGSAYRSLFCDPDYAGAIPSSTRELGRDGPWEQRHARFWAAVDHDSAVDRQHLVDLYDAGIRETDAVLGRFLDDLRRRDVGDDTIVIVLSDHGEQFYEHGGTLHEALYQELLHVPLIVHVPDAWAPGPAAEHRGARVAHGVQLVDVLPTALELLRLPVPDHVQGRALLPLAERPPALPYVFSAWPRDGSWSLRYGGWKLIRAERDGRLVEELYHLADDPHERRDVAVTRPRERAAMAERLDALRGASRAYRASLDEGQEVQLDAAVRAELEALGYLGGGLN